MAALGVDAPSGLADQPQLAGRDHGVERRSRTELGAYRAHVGPHGGVANSKPHRDLPWGDAVCEGLKHLALARAQALSFVVALDAVADQARDRLRRNEASAARDSTDGRDQLRSRARLEDVGACCGFDRSKPGVVASIAAQESKLHPGKDGTHSNR